MSGIWQRLCAECRLYCDYDRSFLRASYAAQRLSLKDASGIGMFHYWLPVQQVLATDTASIAYRGEELAHELDLYFLYVGFSSISGV